MGWGRAKWFKRYSVGIFLFLWLGCSKFHSPLERIGCVPVFQKSASVTPLWAVGTSTDILSEHLKSCFSSHIFVYPTKQLWNTIELDSISFFSYRVRYARQLHLDWLITVSFDSFSSCIAWRGYHFDRDGREKFSFHVNTPIGVWQGAVSSVIDTLAKYEKWPHSCAFQIPKQGVSFWETYGKAVIGHWQEKWDVADSAFQKVLAIEPQWEKPALARIEVLLQLAKHASVFPEAYFYAEADTLLHALETKQYSDYRVPWFRGKWYLQQERWHAAEISLISAYHQCPQEPLLWMDISRLHPSRFRKLGFSDRISIYQKVLKMVPTHEEAWISLTEAFLHQGRLEAVEDACKKWLSIFPRSLDAWFTLAKVFALRNDFLRLAEIYQQLIEWYPQQPEVYYNLGVLYFQSHRFSEAEAFFLQALERKGNPDAYYYLGLIYEHFHQPEKAIQAYRKRIAVRQSRSDRYAEQARVRLQSLLTQREST